VVFLAVSCPALRDHRKRGGSHGDTDQISKTKARLALDCVVLYAHAVTLGPFPVVGLAHSLVQLRSLALARRVLSSIASRSQLVVFELSQAEGIGGQQTEMAGMTARAMAKIACRVEDSVPSAFLQRPVHPNGVK
jgi:hypothetical protein